MRRRSLALAALALSMALGGCFGQRPPEKSRYILAVERPGEGEPLDAGNLRIGRFRVAPAFEREGFVYRLGETRWESDVFNVFARPPGMLTREGAGEWLDASRIFSSVLGATDHSPIDWILEARIQRFYADLREEPKVVVGARFTVLDSRSTQLDAVFRSDYGVTQAAQGSDPVELLDAWSRAWSMILTSLESDLRAHFEARAADGETRAADR